MKLSRRYVVRFITIFLFSLCFSFFVLFSGFVSSEVLERVVAVVNDEVILLTELKSELSARKESGSGLTVAEVLDEMINDLILLEEARKYILKNTTANIEFSIVDIYIERRIKALIHIPYDEVETYYADNREVYGNKEFYDVKDEIESSMVDKELKIRMLRHTEELRKKSYVRIQLEDSD